MKTGIRQFFQLSSPIAIGFLLGSSLALAGTVGTSTRSSFSWESFGVLLTFILGVFNLGFTYRVGKQQALVQSLTRERIDWINGIRDDISRLNGLVYFSLTYYKLHQVFPEEAIRDASQCISAARFRISPRHIAGNSLDEQTDQLLAELQTLIFTYSDFEQVEEDLAAKIQSLNLKVQDLINLQWEKIKQEARQ